MDFSNTPIRGEDLIKKDALRKGEEFKINFLRKNFSKLKLFPNGQKHIVFVNNINDRLTRNIKLSEAQIKYLDTLFDEILEKE